MNPYGGYSPGPSPQPTPQQLQQREALRQEGRFIGAGMLFLMALSQFLYTAVVLLLVLTGAIPAEAIAQSDLGLGNTGYLLVYMSVYVVMMGLPMVLAALLFKKQIQPFGPAKRISPLVFIGGVLAGIALCVVANVVASYLMAFMNAFGIPEPAMPELMENTPVSFWMNMLVFAVLPAILEEMVFRGYLLQSLRPYGDRTALLVSSLLFALMHGNVLQVPFAFIVGLVLGYVVIETNNFWLAVCIHFANNAMSNILQYLQLPMKSALEKNRMTTLVFAALAIVGFVVLIVLRARRKLGMPLKENRDGVSTGSQFAALCTSPAFLVSFILFILLILLNVATSMAQAGAAA